MTHMSQSHQQVVPGRSLQSALGSSSIRVAAFSCVFYAYIHMLPEKDSADKTDYSGPLAAVLPCVSSHLLNAQIDKREKKRYVVSRSR